MIIKLFIFLLTAFVSGADPTLDKFMGGGNMMRTPYESYGGYVEEFMSMQCYMKEGKIYVDTDDDDRLSRVIRRDIIERGRTATDVLDRYEKTVKPMHREFIEPSRRHADIIVPNYGDPAVAINILLTVIEKKIGNSSTRF